MKLYPLIVTTALFTGCMNSPVNLAWRGVIETTEQQASTEGKITNRPRHGNASVNAEKTTDAKLDIPLTK